MKLKEIDRNGNITWSPKSLDKTYLVVGTASQQLDSNFSSKSQLEIFEYNPHEKSCDMPVACSVSSETKFSKLLWGNVTNNYGLIVAGSDNGVISVYDCKRLLEDKTMPEEYLSEIAVKREHKGAVHAMDFNKFKSNLLATGGAESDIFIWDLDKFDEPMTPGNKSQPFEEIRSLSWNHKVQHILGSTSNHRCQIWDLRKSDPVIKLSDTQMKMKCSKLVWHPDISTRLCIASEDDHTPIIQLWDLRYIQCPFNTLQRHTKGIVDLEWCVDDPDILMSVGKDRQIICWNMAQQSNSSNPNNATEVIYEWQLDQELLNEARFCPKHPGLVAVSSFDCHISVYSLMGGRGHVPREMSDTVIDSFPLELYEEDNNEIERIKKEAEKAAELQLVPTPCLSKAPKWLKRPCGASFSFGGRLVQFGRSESSRSRNNSVSQTSVTTSMCYDNIHKIYISQVSTNKSLIQASHILDDATTLGTEALLDYCQHKIQSITTTIADTDNHKLRYNSTFDLDVWKFIECHFFEDSRSAFMQNLGYGDTNTKTVDISEYDEHLLNDKQEISDEGDNFTNEPLELSFNNIQLLPHNEGIEQSLSVALMTGDIDSAVDICLNENRSGEAAILAVSSGRQDLFEKVQKKIFETSDNQPLTTQLIYIAVKRNWNELVKKCDLRHWKEALAWLLTYASTEELSELCEILGQRLEERDMHEVNDSSFSLSACICYICAGSINNFVRCWLRYNSFNSTRDLQRLIEIIVMLCKSVGDDDFSSIKGDAAEIFRRYALLIASQGNLLTALKYLGSNDDTNIVMLRHRICERLRNNLPTGVVAPKVPFKLTNIAYCSVKPNVKPVMNVPIPTFDNKRPMNNQQPPNSFPSSPSYQVKQTNIINPPISNMLSNDPKIPFIGNQFNTISKQPPISNNASQNYFPLSYPPQNPNQMSYVPNNSNTYLPMNVSMNAPPPMNINPNIQKLNNPANKSAWNDPPLLSENYRSESNKEEVKVQPNFFNPSACVTDISEVTYLGNKFNSNAHGFINSPPQFNSFPYNVNNATTITEPILLNNVDQSYSNINETKDNDRLINLSPEYEHIQKVLINLIDKCRQMDKSRQTKVKMDDIQKKINHLFDLLRTKSLSPELTSGLNALIGTIENNQYRQSVEEVNHIIQTINFSEAGLYLPSVKMLIQFAIKILG